MHPEIEQDEPGSCPKYGMDLEPKYVEADADDDDPELRKMTLHSWIAAALTIPLFLLAMLPMLGVPLHDWISRAVSNWIQLALCTPAVLWAGWPFFVRGARSVRTWNLNMFTLIALGTGAAFFYSLVAVLLPDAIPEAFRHGGHAEV